MWIESKYGLGWWQSKSSSDGGFDFGCGQRTVKVNGKFLGTTTVQHPATWHFNVVGATQCRELTMKPGPDLDVILCPIQDAVKLLGVGQRIAVSQ